MENGIPATSETTTPTGECVQHLDLDGFLDWYDSFPDDPNEWSDSDYDGFGDNTDAFPYDLSEWSDSDSDGYGDNTDAFRRTPRGVVRL